MSIVSPQFLAVHEEPKILHESVLLLLCQPAFYHLFETRYELLEAVPWLRQLVADLPPQRSGFDPTCLCRGYRVDKVALGQFLL